MTLVAAQSTRSTTPFIFFLQDKSIIFIKYIIHLRLKKIINCLCIWLWSTSQLYYTPSFIYFICHYQTHQEPSQSIMFIHIAIFSRAINYCNSLFSIKILIWKKTTNGNGFQGFADDRWQLMYNEK